MAVIKGVSSKASITNAINYVTKDEKVIERHVSGYNLNANYAKQEMAMTKQMYGKEGGRTYKHFVQSFAPGEKITAKEAHEIACEFVRQADLFSGFEVLIATHEDTDHVHTHFIVNSVSFEDGHKFQMNGNDMYGLYAVSDRICSQHGLSQTSKGMTFEGGVREETTAYDRGTYEILKSAEAGNIKSYVWDIANKVLDAKETATSREGFMRELENSGIKVNWTDKRKYITFEDKDGNKIRNSKLEQYFNIPLSKGDIEHEFEINKEREITADADRIIEAARSSVNDSAVRTESAAANRNERDAERIRQGIATKQALEREAARRREEERKMAADRQRRKERQRDRDFEL